MNRSPITKLVDKSAITVAFLFSFVAPLAAEDIDPRQRTGPKASDPAVLVTGPLALLQDQVVTGGPATAQIRLTPVATHPSVMRDASKADLTMEAKVRSLSGTVSFDDVNSPVTITS